MKLHATKTQIITAAAVLLLLGGFTTVFALPTNPGQPASATTSISSAPLPTVSKSSTTTTTVAPTATTSIVICNPISATSATCIPLCPTFFDLKLNPVPVLNAATTYRYGTGHAILTIRGDAIYLQAVINNANPLTQYSITLDINGVSHLLATMVTDQNGNGQVTAQILLQNGVYAISVQVFDTSSFTLPTLVLQSASVTVKLPAVGPSPITICPLSVGVNAQP